MQKYRDLSAAEAAGYGVTHLENQQMFALSDAGGQQVGVAHYSVQSDNSLDFDHTAVSPALRGTGLAEILVRTALNDSYTQKHRVTASCWYVAKFLDAHPELSSPQK